MTITIEELIKRPVINPQKSFEFMQKMSDEEYKEWETEIIVNAEGDDFDLTSKIIDRDILYNVLKLAHEEN